MFLNILTLLAVIIPLVLCVLGFLELPSRVKWIFGGILSAAMLLLLAMILPSIHRAKPRSQATRMLEDLRMIDEALNQYALEFKKQSGEHVSWNDIQLYLKPGTKLYTSSGNDLFSNPYRFRAVGDLPKLSPLTYEALSDVAPQEFWSPYY